MSKRSRHNRRGIAMLLDAEQTRRDAVAADDDAAPSDAWTRPTLSPLQVRALPILPVPSIDVAALAVPALHRLMGPNAAGNRG
jgi:hypothetical protein